MTTRPTIEANQSTNHVVTAAEWNTNVIQAANYLLEKTDGTNADTIGDAALGADTTRHNLLTNPGLEQWQRGTGAFTANNAYTADRWQISLGGTSTVSVSQTTTNQDPTYGGAAAAAITYTHAASGSLTYQQPLNDLAVALRGLTVTLSAMVSSNAACVVQITDAGATATSTTHPGDGTYHRLNVTKAITSSTTILSVALFANTASATMYLDNCMLVVSTNATTYLPFHPSQDVARCQRYYQVLPVDLETYSGSGGTYTQIPIIYPVTMAGTPTATLTQGTGTNANLFATSPLAVPRISNTGCRISMRSASAADTYILGYTIVLEFNP